MFFKDNIFRAYDIRGIYEREFDAEGFFLIAKAFVSYISRKFDKKNPQIFVSGDGRTSYDILRKYLISGLFAGGAKVSSGEKLPTPMNFFARISRKFDASIQITASHNPADYNGLKLTDKGGSISGDEIQVIKNLAKNLPLNDEIKIFENFETIEIEKEYEQKILQSVEIKKSAYMENIVVDAGNGIAGSFFPEILAKFGYKIEKLFCDLDGKFPNHQPDPERPKNLQDLILKIREKKADWGFAFDGDGDRVGIVDCNENIISADKIIFVLAADLLSRHPQATIVVDIMSSAILINKLKILGANVIVAKTGHSFIEEDMKKYSALLGGEQSGHFMFAENFYGHDDALLASLRFLSAIKSQPQLITEINKNWLKMQEFSERIEVENDEIKNEILANFLVKAKQIFPDANDLDGLRIDFADDEWAIVRASNTSPCIAVRIEAKTDVSLNSKKEQILSLLKYEN